MLTFWKKHCKSNFQIFNQLFIQLKKLIFFYFSILRYPEYNFIYDKSQIIKASKQLIQKKLYDWDSSIGLIDLFILSKCDFVVATHSSNFGRLVYEFMHIEDPDPFHKFKSVDRAYFIHGYKTGIKL